MTMKLQLPRPRQEEIGLNLTPLIDVVFLLLIFLLVTTTFTSQTYLEVELPTLESQQTPPIAAIEVWVQSSGDIWIAGRRWDSNQSSLRVAIGNALAELPQGHLLIMADPAAPSQALLDILSASGAMGQTRVIFSGARRVED